MAPSLSLLAALTTAAAAGDDPCAKYACVGGMLWCPASNGCFPPKTSNDKCSSGFFCSGRGNKGGGTAGGGSGGGRSPAPPPPVEHIPKILPPVPSKSSSSLMCLIIGDWGGASDSTPTSGSQRSTAAGMGIVGAKLKPEFIIGLGDNFYGSGINPNNQWRFKATFEDTYAHDSLQVPWYHIAGNHDWQHRNIDLQIDYSKKSHRWIFPSAMYTVRRQLPTGETAKFVMFDGLAASRRHPWSPLKGKSYDGVAWEDERPADGWYWLDQELKASQDDYLFLIDHHPVYTVCSHGPTRTHQGIPELMKKYKVTAFMSGHDHCLMHLSKDGNTFMLIGAAAQAWNPSSKRHVADEAGVKTHYEISRGNKGHVSGGFGAMQLTGQHATIDYYDNHGNVLHHLSLASRKHSVVV